MKNFTYFIFWYVVGNK